MATNGLITTKSTPSRHGSADPDERNRAVSWQARRALALAHALQTTLDLETLIELFSTEAAKDVAHDGLIYRNADMELELRRGRQAPHRCSYRLLVGGHSLGEVEVCRRRRFTEQETMLLEYMLSSLLYPLRNALMYRKAVYTALRDPLTGVHNRSALDAALRREVDLARRHGTSLALVVLDIDHFKAVNDRHGHLVGDCVLRDVAAHAGACIRSTDMLFRYGGEEFVILLSNTDAAGARRLAERIRKAVDRLDCRYGDTSIRVTASLGATCLCDDDSAETLFARADQALLDAKRTGRNRVVYRHG